MADYLGKQCLDCKKTLSLVGLADKADIWESNWDLSNKYQPREFLFFDERFIGEIVSWLGMAEEQLEAFLQSRESFSNNQALQRLFWHCYYVITHSDKALLYEISRWPMLPKDICEYSDMFYAFVVLACIADVRRVHREKMIPEEISRDTLSDFELWMREHYRKTGRNGFSQLTWLINHITCNLFKLGRLQFQFHTCHFNIYAFRNIRNGAIIVFPSSSEEFRQDGQYYGANNIFREEERWQAYFNQTETEVVGNFISPLGKAERKQITLKKTDWQLALQKGDPVLAVHIPATGPMTHKLCGESFKQALEFFPKYFPGYKFQGFTCQSWLLDAQLEQYLPSESNIVKFLREFYLLPIPNANDTQTFERVFGRKYENIDDAPQETSLQRAIVKHCKAGGHWRDAGMIYFPEDVAFWGQSIYRHRYTEML